MFNITNSYVRFMNLEVHDKYTVATCYTSRKVVNRKSGEEEFVTDFINRATLVGQAHEFGVQEKETVVITNARLEMNQYDGKTYTNILVFELEEIEDDNNSNSSRSNSSRSNSSRSNSSRRGNR